MKAFKGIPWWSVILGTLLVANLGWISWNVRQHAGLVNAGKQFRVEVLHTNDMDGIGLFDAKTREPLWTRYSLKGQRVVENHYFQGRDVFDVTLISNRPPVYYAFFYGPGKSFTWWLNAGGADTFTQRMFYDANGDPSGSEVWYNRAWNPVDRRDGKNGIIVAGQWRRLGFDTNGMWTIDPVAGDHL
jgi:hypothetical protein